MPEERVTMGNLCDKMFEVAKSTFGDKFACVKHYLKPESEKLAITLRMIIEARAKGEISNEEAAILFNQQKIASTAVLAAAEGMSAVAAQAGLDAAANVVKTFVNSKIGFPLL